MDWNFYLITQTNHKKYVVPDNIKKICHDIVKKWRLALEWIEFQVLQHKTEESVEELNITLSSSNNNGLLEIPSAVGKTFFSWVSAFFIVTVLNPSNSLLRSKLTLGRSFNDGLTGFDIVWSFCCNQSATRKHHNNIHSAGLIPSLSDFSNTADALTLGLYTVLSLYFKTAFPILNFTPHLSYCHLQLQLTQYLSHYTCTTYLSHYIFTPYYTQTENKQPHNVFKSSWN